MTILKRLLPLALLLALFSLPIQQFWIRPIELAGGPDWLTLALTNWPAPIIFGFAVAGLIRHRPQGAVDWALIGFFILAVVPVLWQFGAFADLLIGWRYTLFAMIGYWIGRGGLTTIEQLEGWLRVALWAVLGLSAIQLVLWLLGSNGFASVLDLEPRFAAGEWWRLYGPMSGPNQLGTFLALAAGWLYWRQKLSRWELLLTIIAVGLTFSRSAFLGLAAGLTLPALIFAAQWKDRLKITGALTLLAAAIVVAVTLSPDVRQGLIEARHADQRFAVINETATRFQAATVGEWLIGHGAGTAGPAADVLQNGGFIPENWFIQIAYEFGLLGLALILLFFGAGIYYGIRRRQPALVALIVLISVNSLFLHPLSDNFAAAVWFYLLLGLGVTRGQTPQTQVK